MTKTEIRTSKSQSYFNNLAKTEIRIDILSFSLPIIYVTGYMNNGTIHNYILLITNNISFHKP